MNIYKKLSEYFYFQSPKLLSKPSTIKLEKVVVDGYYESAKQPPAIIPDNLKYEHWKTIPNISLMMRN